MGEGGVLDREPVLIILSGLAAVLSTLLVATNTLGWTHLEPGQTAAVIAAVAAFCGLVGTAIRGQVYSAETHHVDVIHALMKEPPIVPLPDEDPPPLDLDHPEP